MRRICLAVLAAAALAPLVWTPLGEAVIARSLVVPQQTELQLSLLNPGAHQRLGLPDFVVAGADAELTEAARSIADVLWDDIDFEHEYYMIRRATSAAIPVMPAQSLPYDRWAEMGADFVLAGSASRSGDVLVLELRMLAVAEGARGAQPFGSKYTCRVSQPRFCAHSIADDFHKQTKGLEGVARTKLAFNSDRDSARVTSRPSQTVAIAKEIYISDYDGANQQRVTVNRNLNISPAWAPGGGLLAYTSYSSGFPDIYVANLSQPGRGLQRPAHGNEQVHNQMAAWSPDGKQIAFVSNRTGNQDIWIVNADGSGARNLTNHPADEGAPAWSPDGNLIAFTSDRETSMTPLLYVMNASGGGVRRLTSVRADRPTWSKQNFIAFTAGGGPGYNIGIIDMSSVDQGIKILTSGGGTNESPAVAPNGRHIAFVTTRWGRQQIAIVDRTGEHVKQITRSGNNTFPNWQPTPR